MKILSNVLSWFVQKFKAAKLRGKIAMIAGAFFFICICFTSLLPSSNNNSASQSDMTAAFETAQAEIWKGITQTVDANIPEPTATILPTETQASLPTATIQSSQAMTASGASCIPNNPPQTGRVVDVVDGDTIKVLLDQDGKTYSVRYIGMDTPENTSQVEYFGAEATAKNAEMVYGKTVTLIKDVSETDRYNRLLRYVLVDDIFVNYELVNQGYATAADYPPDISCSTLFHDTEYNAKSLLLGLWASQSIQSTQSPTSEGLVIVSVNKQTEYVDIRNNTGAPINLSGWVLVSEKGNQSCSLGGTIQSGEVLRVWAESGQTGYSCGYSSPIWNNSALDPAVLYNSQGQEVSRYP